MYNRQILSVFWSWRFDRHNVQMHGYKSYCLSHIDRWPWRIGCYEVRAREIEAEEVIVVKKANDLAP